MNTEPENICGLKRADFQTTVDGKQTDLFILKNNQGNEVAITNYGGAIVAIMVPDKDGKHANVIQGHDNIQDVINSPEPSSVFSSDASATASSTASSPSTAKSTSWLSTMETTISMAVLQVSMPMFGMPCRYMTMPSY